MAGHDIIVVGASAGGVEAITDLARQLPADLPAAVLVTLHFPSSGTSVLPRILRRAGRLPAEHARNGEPIVCGRIYIAPPDFHLLAMRGRIHVVRGPRENGYRPAIDPMFRSAAAAFGPRVIGVVLTGNLDDGTSGLLVVKRRGGIAVVQDPDEAPFPSMPQSAIDHVDVDHVTPIREMGRLLEKLARTPVDSTLEGAMAGDAEHETEYSSLDLQAIEQTDQHPGEPAMYGCPDCGGTLWMVREGDFVRYRCRVGHGWSSEALLARQAEQLDAALWTALRALEESASLSRQMAGRARSRENLALADRFSQNAEESARRAEVIREALLQGKSTQMEPDADRSGTEPQPESQSAEVGDHAAASGRSPAA